MKKPKKLDIIYMPKANSLVRLAVKDSHEQGQESEVVRKYKDIPISPKASRKAERFPDIGQAIRHSRNERMHFIKVVDANKVKVSTKVSRKMASTHHITFNLAVETFDMRLKSHYSYPKVDPFASDAVKHWESLYLPARIHHNFLSNIIAMPVPLHKQKEILSNTEFEKGVSEIWQVPNRIIHDSEFNLKNVLPSIPRENIPIETDQDECDERLDLLIRIAKLRHTEECFEDRIDEIVQKEKAESDRLFRRYRTRPTPTKYLKTNGIRHKIY